MKRQLSIKDEYIQQFKKEFFKCLNGNANSHQLEMQKIKCDISLLLSSAGNELLQGNTMDNVF